MWLKKTQMTTEDKTVDVVIPVYNAKKATFNCINSIYEHAGHKISGVYIHDDKSDPDTAEMLDSLDYPDLHIYHSRQNSGFADGVNQGVSRTSSEYVLVLNSDTVAEDDFISPLIKTLDSHEKMAALNVCGERFKRKDFNKYEQTKGYVKSYNLSGYAFLIRRKAFNETGGFDTAFGRGYFEDADLSRRLISAGWQLGLHPDTCLRHEHQGSFKNIKGVNELIENNKRKFFFRYPSANRRILLFSDNTKWQNLPEQNLRDITKIIEEGGRVYWASKNQNLMLPALEVKFFKKNSIRRLIRLMNARQKDRYKGIEEIWFSSDTCRLKIKLYSWLARKRNIKVKIIVDCAHSS